MTKISSMAAQNTRRRGRAAASPRLFVLASLSVPHTTTGAAGGDGRYSLCPGVHRWRLARLTYRFSRSHAAAKSAASRSPKAGPRVTETRRDACDVGPRSRTRT